MKELLVSVLNRHIICGDRMSSWLHPVCLAVFEISGQDVIFGKDGVWKERESASGIEKTFLSPPLDIPNPLSPFDFSLKVPPRMPIVKPSYSEIQGYLKIRLMTNIEHEMSLVRCSVVKGDLKSERLHLSQLQNLIMLYGRLDNGFL